MNYLKKYWYIGIIAIAAAILAVAAGNIRPNQPQLPVAVNPPQATSTPPVITPTTTDVITGDVDTSEWKTYKNEEYGFEFRYPSEYLLKTPYPYYYDAKNNADVGVNNYNTIRSGSNYSCSYEFYVVVENNPRKLGIQAWLEDGAIYKKDRYLTLTQYNKSVMAKDPFAGIYREEIKSDKGLNVLVQYYGTEGGGYMRLLIAKSDKLYSLTVFSENAMFVKEGDYYRGICKDEFSVYDKIIGSFNFTN